MNIDSNHKRDSKKNILSIAVFGLLFAFIFYLVPSPEDIPPLLISIEEVELVHVMLNEIERESPKLSSWVESFRAQFAEHTELVGPPFFKEDTETRHQILLRAVLNSRYLLNPTQSTESAYRE